VEPPIHGRSRIQAQQELLEAGSGICSRIQFTQELLEQFQGGRVGRLFGQPDLDEVGHQRLAEFWVLAEVELEELASDRTLGIKLTISNKS
jgi:hypothetical protein